MTHEKKINSQYYREFGGAMLLYTVVLFGALTYGPAMTDGVLKTAVMVSPMIPVLLSVWAIARHFARVDEYVRLWTMENMAISYAVTAAVTFTYGFLENVGFPRISMFAIWPFMAAVWGIAAIARGACKR